MNFDTYQKQAADRSKIKMDYAEVDTLVVFTLGLVGESGEVAKELEHVISDNTIGDAMMDRIVEELGDTLWYIAGICDWFNIDLEQVAEANLSKLLKYKNANGG